MITLLRTAYGNKTTLGHLYVNNIFQCYTLEDLPREVKIPGQTCIPEGEYRLGLNTTAGLNAQYQRKYPGQHQGMLEIKGIPDFSLVFIHIGNYHQDTAGCPLTGSYYQLIDGDYRVLHSADAYKRAYSALVEEIEQGRDEFVVTSCELRVMSCQCSEAQAKVEGKT